MWREKRSKGKGRKSEEEGEVVDCKWKGMRSHSPLVWCYEQTSHAFSENQRLRAVAWLLLQNLFSVPCLYDKVFACSPCKAVCSRAINFENNSICWVLPRNNSFFPHQQVSHPEDHFDSSYNAIAVLQGYMYSSWTGGPGKADCSRPLSPLDSSLKIVPIHNLYARNLSSCIYPWFSWMLLCLSNWKQILNLWST